MSSKRRIHALCFVLANVIALIACSSAPDRPIGTSQAQVQGFCASNADCTGGTVCDLADNRCRRCDPSNGLCSTG
jgi:hypothetical protein